jgi:hypothetical protein
MSNENNTPSTPETETPSNVSEVKFGQKAVAPAEAATEETAQGTPSNVIEDPQEADPNKLIDSACRQFVENVYNSVDYKSMFNLLGQPEKYAEFEAYVADYTSGRKKLEEGESARLWGSFLEDKPLTSLQGANLIDQVTSMMLSISISAGKVISGVIYDVVIGNQFMNVQLQHEQFAGAIGELHRRLERIEQAYRNEETQPDEAPKDQVKD